MKLSIITINYNNGIGLKKTIESVLNQNNKDYEYIIIDGGSSDSSIDVIKSFENHISYWVSEPDGGIYNAMNKAIGIAQAEYIYFLNSGDLINDHEVLSKIAPHLNNEHIVYGNLFIQEPNKGWLKIYPPVLTYSFFLTDSLPHSGGAFILREAFCNELSKYDESLKIISDWKWFMLALFKYNYSYKHVNLTIGIFDYSGISANPKNFKLLKLEQNEVIQKSFKLIDMEVSELLNYKNKYILLKSSRYIKICLKIKGVLKILV